jgi:hypothetical protein
MGSELLESHTVQLRKVVMNWAEQVEMGHWDVDENEVAGGLEKSKDAGTLEYWGKYHISLYILVRR